ncbi:AraC family transcriptional regulator [Streptomyces hoynatensis]|uniref:AraC family transcriptional regulator n=1 Tax=Streptomyces hoynatensis TaxID=1141874 RepID=A0A3A9YWX6_9ACTN|nr:AraC family transcriptional regulator [Streptomyces hoynatensis]
MRAVQRGPPTRGPRQVEGAVAADLLRDTEEPIAAVGRRVGYADAFAFSAAFRRLRGVGPSGRRRLGR